MTGIEAPKICKKNKVCVTRWSGKGYIRIFSIFIAFFFSATGYSRGGFSAPGMGKPPFISAAQKKEISQNDYDLWKSIHFATLSPDGMWVAYSLDAPTGESELVVRSTQSPIEFRVSRGHFTRGSSPGTEEDLQIAADSGHVLFKIGANPGSRSMLGILNLPDGSVTEIPEAIAFKLPKKSGRYVAYVSGSIIAAPDKSEAGRKLTLRDLSANQKIQIASVSSFTFDYAGRYLAYTVSSTNPHENGAYVRVLAIGQTASLAVGPGDYRSLNFDRSGRQIAFLLARDESRQGNACYSIYYTSSPFAGVDAVVRPTVLKAGLHISPDAGVGFSRAGNALIFGVAPDGLSTRDVTESSAGASFDLWHWRDPVIQSEQIARAQSGQVRSYTAVYHIKERRLAQLGNESMAWILLSDDAYQAIGIDQSPYMVQSTWAQPTADVYAIDGLSGESRQLLRAFKSAINFPRHMFLSPSGRYFLYFDDRRWYSYDLINWKRNDLTGTLLPDVQFESPGVTGFPITLRSMAENIPWQTSAIGIGMWTPHDRRVLIYDQYDIWEADPSGVTLPRNFTAGLGRKEHIIFRLWPHVAAVHAPYWDGTAYWTPLEEKVDATQSLLLTAYDTTTIATGIWSADAGAGGAPRPLVMRNKDIKLLSKAGHPQQYLATQETFREFPDLWTGSRLDRLRKISDVNPQQTNYRWGSAELIEWTSDSGARLKGVLYKPENFDPAKKYPMIVMVMYIYDQASRDLYKYIAPEPMRHALSDYASKYTSRDYLVFKPDLAAQRPYMGSAAMNAIVPAVQLLIDYGIVDKSRVAAVGHSYGAWPTAYLATHTKLFRCIVQSAGWTDLISTYGGIRGGGVSDAGLMERSVIGTSIWDNPDAYLAESPVLRADRVATPLLIMHNDHDQAAPFAQAIEFYIALRRNAKEVYLFNYNKEGHVLMNYHNVMDWDRRVQQFLDHFLKDAPLPDWMAHGIPYGEKGRNFGFGTPSSP